MSPCPNSTSPRGHRVFTQTLEGRQAISTETIEIAGKSGRMHVPYLLLDFVCVVR